MKPVILLLSLLLLNLSKVQAIPHPFPIDGIPIREALDEIMEKHRRPGMSDEGMYCLKRNPKEIISNSQEDLLFVTFFPTDPSWAIDLPIDQEFKADYNELKDVARKCNYRVNSVSRYWLHIKFDDLEDLYDFTAQFVDNIDEAHWIQDLPLNFFIRIGYISLTRNSCLNTSY